MFEYYDDDVHEDGDVDIKPAFDPPKLTKKSSSFLINRSLKTTIAKE